MSIRRRNNAQSVLLATLVVVLAVVAVGGGFAYQLWTRGQTLGADYCRQAGPSGILAIAIDATDLLSEAQRLDVLNRVETAIDEADANWRVELWNVAPTSGVPTMTGDPVCIPPQNVSPLTGNPGQAKARFSEFKVRIHRKLVDVLGQSGSAASPILESIQAVGLRSFGSPGLANARAHRLLLVSDLVQNTSRVSFVKGLPAYEQFRAGKTFEAVRAPLSGATVDVLFLSRPSALSSSEVVGWWQKYFSDIGASLASVQRIVG